MSDSSVRILGFDPPQREPERVYLRTDDGYHEMSRLAPGDILVGGRQDRRGRLGGMRLSSDGPLRIWFGTGEPLDLASDPPVVGDEDGVGPMFELTDYVIGVRIEAP